MKIQFDASQAYQLDAIRAITDLFDGQPLKQGESEISLSGETQTGMFLSEQGLANQLLLDDGQILQNLLKIQHANGLELSAKLERLSFSNGEGNSIEAEFPNFTVEMETGTGKTYVYLRTVYELNKRYGFKKFVIVVPSVAIREGVLKNLQITHEHFQTLYNREPCAFTVYDSAKVNQLRGFALSNAIQILVINIDAFSKDSGDSPEQKGKGNVINQTRETGIKPIEFIQRTNPIVIVDEPQNMETDIRKQAIARLNPLCTLRYSATPRNAYNLVYKLSPVQAFELGLVKQIGVHSVIEQNSANAAYIEVEGFKSSSRSTSAKVKLWVNQGGGAVKKTVTVKNGDDLSTVSNGRDSYKEGFIVNDIHLSEGYVEFANEVRVYQGKPQGALTDEILKNQIDATVRRHLEKEAKYQGKGIKVLSVFFIDKVANYRYYDEQGNPIKGKFALWFEAAFTQHQERPEYADLYGFSAEAAHNGYFSQDKKGRFKDSSETRPSLDDNEAYALIMQEKERLLDPDEPLRFIFSHSALREGWDNPNVFQICTLNETASEMKKRQEIGRGLRLAVNRFGERITDRPINHLTIVANESYQEYASKLQQEMEQVGLTFKKNIIINERDKVTVRLIEENLEKEWFLELWERIKARTRYQVRYDTARLIEAAAKRVKEMPKISSPKLLVIRSELAISKTGITSKETGRRSVDVENIHYAMPDFIAQIQTRTALSKSTLASILLKSERLDDAIKNPQVFIDSVAQAINNAKQSILVEGVEYQRVETQEYQQSAFKEDNGKEYFKGNVIPVSKLEKTLFSHIVIDSDSKPEKKFMQACENSEDVMFYLKLPAWFRIDTPVGTYNPDWALVYKNDKTLYFVAETKGTTDLTLLRPLEKLKIECGKKHFKLFERVEFKVVKEFSELLA
ncbi:MAG: restriction endonuclease [Candidatus Methylumidiphilus alinenensis]|uniref:Restriction endonuclease n=1 Tax=Candidatus Methylumidiphilus alinenensis TaxID=2202197 RepID=A0A2W4RFI9_9GAMM|nr:MAG: restriction endonuclease [Candidatus Methylumidiphilus alinenensis]